LSVEQDSNVQCWQRSTSINCRQWLAASSSAWQWSRFLRQRRLQCYQLSVWQIKYPLLKR